MATQLKNDNYSNETKDILHAVKNGENFLLSGGAGSGKTYSLVETIKGLIEQNPLARIACITYTNAATQEIEHRVNHENLYVSTIHDFLWKCIKHYQVELKKTLVDLINDEDQTLFNVTSDSGEIEKIQSLEGNVEYKEYVKLKNGIISHDQIPMLANAVFSTYPKICRITNDKFKFILVDEYQDTSPLVIKILLEHLASTPRRNIVGFFGDAMQSIYESGIGNLDNYKGSGNSCVTEIQKSQNRRNPISVIDLANKFRTDGLLQEPSEDYNAPNMNDGKPIVGSIKFLYSKQPNIQAARDFLGWETKFDRTKELNLTHNLIAIKAGFQNLMRIYDADKVLEYVKRIKNYIKLNLPQYLLEDKTFQEVLTELKEGKSDGELKKVNPTDGQADYIKRYAETYELALSTKFADLASLYIDKDMLIDDQKADQSMLGSGGTTRDNLVKHLHRIQTLIELYQNGEFNEFMRATDLKIGHHKDKLNLQKEIHDLSEQKEKTIGEIIEQAHVKGLVRKDDRLNEFAKSKSYIFNQVSNVLFSEFQDLYKYIDGQTPFSTQHKTKGREFDNVLVVMDNGRWNNYNFEAFFTGDAKDSVLARTRKIVYVCCTRAKNNLALFYPEPSNAVLDRARELFGQDNVINLDTIQ